ncbi:MAG: putative bifunctional diguanylate cyclase/phosphodiesterase [Acidimicrobiales bacterium]
MTTPHHFAQAPQDDEADLPSLEGEDIERMCMRNLLETTEEGIYFKDLKSRFILASRGFVLNKANGTSMDDIVGKTDFDLFSEEHALAAYQDEQRIIQTGEPIVGKIERETFRDRPDAWVSTTKMPLRDRAGRIVGTFGISRDITAQVRAEQALAYQALHDSVTGLANRTAFIDRLSQALLAMERSGGQVGVFFIDLDNFKEINDTFGHATGDRVLVEVGHRLSRVARTGDTVARFGGDEFAVLCVAPNEGSDLARVARRALDAIDEPLFEGGRDLSVSASIGAVMTCDYLADCEELLKQADIAMYEAKAAGRNCVRVYRPDLGTSCRLDDDFGTALRKALSSGQLFVVYQPLFSLEERRLRGAEALVRWQHPERGVLSPADFVPLAEERGLIGIIDAFVLDEACGQLAEWAREELVGADFTMAVNLSGHQLDDPALAARLAEVLAKHHVPPAQLCIEINEEAVRGRAADAEAALAELGRLGVQLALDDFGTYSTLANLARLGVDIVKIDRSLVGQVLTARDSSRDVVAAIAAMAHVLGMSAVSVGLEEQGQMDAVAAIGCDTGQGYLFSKPLHPDELAELCRSARGSTPAAPGRAQRPTTRRSASRPVRHAP